MGMTELIATGSARIDSLDAYVHRADGEDSVSTRLEHLEGWGWRVLHAVTIGRRGTDYLDHLLIGPGGVFAISTKDHGGSKVSVSQEAIFVNDNQTDHLETTYSKGHRVAEVLKRETPWTVPVTPTVVVISDTYVVKRLPKDVLVIRRSDAPNYFQRMPRVYADEVVDWLYDTASESATWK